LNRGLDEIVTDLVIFLDDDDRLHPAALDDLSRALERCTGAVASIGGMRFFDDAGRARRMPHPRLTQARRVWPEILSGWNVGRGQMLCRAGEVRAAGSWIEDVLISDDTYFALRVALRGDCVVIPALVLDKRMHAENEYTDTLPRLDREVRQRFVQELSPQDRAIGDKALKFFDSWLEAHAAYHTHGDYRRALRGYRRAATIDSALATSPLIRGRLVREATKSLLGSLPMSSKVLDGARRANRSILRRLGRYPDLGPAHLPSNPEDRSP
jgi:glycosyltransferase involved in cell wall biosynthesis